MGAGHAGRARYRGMAEAGHKECEANRICWCVKGVLMCFGRVMIVFFISPARLYSYSSHPGCIVVELFRVRAHPDTAYTLSRVGVRVTVQVQSNLELGLWQDRFILP